MADLYPLIVVISVEVANGNPDAFPNRFLTVLVSSLLPFAIVLLRKLQAGISSALQILGAVDIQVFGRFSIKDWL